MLSLRFLSTVFYSAAARRQPVLDLPDRVCYDAALHRVTADSDTHSSIENPMPKVHKDIQTFLEKWLDKSVKQYVAHMDGQQNGGLHHLIIGGVEKPLLEIVLEKTEGNRTKAANILGINRNTLRKKIQDYNIQCPDKN